MDFNAIHPVILMERDKKDSTLIIARILAQAIRGPKSALTRDCVRRSAMQLIDGPHTVDITTSHHRMQCHLQQAKLANECILAMKTAVLAR